MSYWPTMIWNHVNVLLSQHNLQFISTDYFFSGPAGLFLSRGSLRHFFAPSRGSTCQALFASILKLKCSSPPKLVFCDKCFTYKLYISYMYFGSTRVLGSLSFSPNRRFILWRAGERDSMAIKRNK